MKTIVKALLIVSMLGLAGCLSPVCTKPDSIYMIGCVPDRVCGRKPIAKTLMVLQPITIPAYNTTKMAYTKKPFQVSYYSKNRWAATPGQMLHPLLVETMQASHFFHAVVAPAFIGHYDYVLTTQVVRFEQDFVCCPPEAVVIIHAQLSNALTNHVIATKDFIACEPMLKRPPYGGVLATNCAVSHVLADIRDFVICNVK